MWSFSSWAPSYWNLKKSLWSDADDAAIQVVVISAAAEADFCVSAKASLQSRSRRVCGQRGGVCHQGALARCSSLLVPSALLIFPLWLTSALTQSKATQCVFHGLAASPPDASDASFSHTHKRVYCFSHISVWFLNRSEIWGLFKVIPEWFLCVLYLGNEMKVGMFHFIFRQKIIKLDCFLYFGWTS